MKRTLITAFIGLILVSGCSTENENYTVTEKEIVESVYSSVIVEPAQKYIIQSAANGYVDLIAYEEGDTITPNEILFQLRDENTQAAAENAKLSYSLAEAYYRGELNQLEDLALELQTAHTKYETDSLNAGRIKQLRKKGLSSEQEWEAVSLQLENSRNQYVILKNRKKRLQRELQTKMQQARNTAVNTSAKLNDLFVRSQISGTIYQLFKEEGEYVMVKEPLAIVGSRNEFTIQMRIDEVDIMKVKKGQEIVISLESYPDEVFKAVVTRILPKMEEQTQTFIVEGKFVKQPTQLYYGLTGEGNIVVNQKTKALVVPLEYITENGEVQTVNGTIPVKLGMRNLSEVEVLDGLQVGDVLIKPGE